MSKEPRVYARQQTHAAFLRFLRNNARVYLVMVAGAAILIAFEALFERGFILGVVAGTVVTTFAAFAVVMYLMHGGGLYQLGGAWAEEFTRDALKKAEKQGVVWQVVNGVRLERQDVDHVVFSPSGVVAIDSKWHFKQNADYWRGDVASATRAAAKTRSVLRSLGEVHEVKPLVVVVGPGAPEDGAAVTIDGVDVIRLDELAGWLDGRSSGRLPSDQSERLSKELCRFRATVNASKKKPRRRVVKLWSSQVR